MYFHTGNFISYCDSMMIATEGVKEGFQKMKAWLIKQFARILDWLEKMIKKMKPDSGMRSKLLKMISRAKSGLSKSKSLNAQNKELADRLAADVVSLNEECKTISEELQELYDEIDAEYADMQKHAEELEHFYATVDKNIDEQLELLKTLGYGNQVGELKRILNMPDGPEKDNQLKLFNIRMQSHGIIKGMKTSYEKGSNYADKALNRIK